VQSSTTNAISLAGSGSWRAVGEGPSARVARSVFSNPPRWAASAFATVRISGDERKFSSRRTRAAWGYRFGNSSRCDGDAPVNEKIVW
jgi:hypothetical protein